MHNVKRNRVAASDVDFRFGPDGNSGALCCYSSCDAMSFDATIHLCDDWLICVG